MTSPPRPPSPPSGPPIGTNFSRRNDEMPDPPSPAFTWIRTRSMNVIAYSIPESDGARPQFVGHNSFQRLERGGVDRGRYPRITAPVQMRLQLPILSRGRARCDDAELAPSQIQLRPAEHLAVAFVNHPVVE